MSISPRGRGLALVVCAMVVLVPRFATAEVIDFTASVWYDGGVPNGGTTISGQITIDPTAVAVTSGGTSHGYAYYAPTAPATFTMTTDGGFAQSRSLTSVYVAEASIGAEGYVFDADVGTIGVTPFTRLELSFSNNPPNLGAITSLNVPTSISLGIFEFTDALYYVYDAQGNLIDRLNGTVTYVNVAPVPLPAAAWLLLSGLGGLGVFTRRRAA